MFALRAVRPLSRTLHTTSAVRSGLTNLFEAAEVPPLAISKLNDKGYLLSDGLIVPGGCIFAGGRALLWDVDPPKGNGSEGLAAAWEGWGVDRFKVFEVLVPRPGR